MLPSRSGPLIPRCCDAGRGGEPGRPGPPKAETNGGPGLLAPGGDAGLVSFIPTFKGLMAMPDADPTGPDRGKLGLTGERRPGNDDGLGGGSCRLLGCGDNMDDPRRDAECEDAELSRRGLDSPPEPGPVADVDDDPGRPSALSRSSPANTPRGEPISDPAAEEGPFSRWVPTKAERSS
jgi:hypothetical protein